MKVNDNNKDYRRGVILGLTMAEIMILIIFLLMLAFAALLQQTKDENKVYKEIFSKNEKLVQRIVKIIETTSSESDEIIRILEKLPEVIQKIRDTDAVIDEKEDISSIIEKGVENYLQEQASLVRDDVSSDTVSPQDQLKIEIEKNNALSERLAVLEKKFRDGVGPPPCWDPGNRRYTEYLYRADLTSNGIILTDISTANWQDKKGLLPIGMIDLGKPISPRLFLAQTEGLWSYSIKNDCRFLILMIDKTLPHEKDWYNSMRKTINARVSIFEPKPLQKSNIAPVSNKQPAQEIRPKETFFERLF